MTRLLSHDHSPEAIRTRLARGPQLSYLRDFVYGGIDGTVTTFAVVSGVVGADLSHQTILILGVANLIADGFSMAASNFLGTRTEQEEKKRLESFEREQIRRNPEGETTEAREILRSIGLSGDVLEKGVAAITKNKEKWVQLMLSEEYGVSANLRSAWRAALTTFFAFAICGVVPLLPYLIHFPNSFAWDSILTGIVFFFIGSLKSRWTLETWWRAGLETFLVGTIAAILAYGIGYALKWVVN